jgi:ketosteroid isomerase-like protein
MSQENVEIARAAIEAAQRKPTPDYEAINALFHPDHEFVSRDVGLEGGSYSGAQGYREWLTGASEVVEWESTLAEVTEIDDERVLAVTPTKFRGKQSGAWTEQRNGVVLTVREGKVVRTEVYRSPEEALEAAGLQE